MDECRFLDWQQARYGSLAFDLLSIIFSSTDRAVRIKEYGNLLNIYYESIIKTITFLGTHSEKLFTFDELKVELKRCGNFVLTVMPILIYGSTAHQIESGSLDVLNIADQFEYERRINEIVEDISDMGYYQSIELNNPHV